MTDGSNETTSAGSCSVDVALLGALSSLEGKRDDKRREIELNFEERTAVRRELLRLERRLQDLNDQNARLERELQGLDDGIANAEHEIQNGNVTGDNAVAADSAIAAAAPPHLSNPEHLQHSTINIPETIESISATPACELLTDPSTQTTATLAQVTTSPFTSIQRQQQHVHKQHQHSPALQALTAPLTLTTAANTSVSTHNKSNDIRSTNNTASTANTTHQSDDQQSLAAATAATIATVKPFSFSDPRRSTSLPRDSLQILSQLQQQQQQQQHQSLSASSDYPWTTHVYDLLYNTFTLNSFRTHQEQIINDTLSGKDVFVIMRTGGGKSLTYQLPALLEGRTKNKVTVVVSPLLSLIQDQQDQLNQYSPGAAVSFSSTVKASEQAHIWQQLKQQQQQHDTRPRICMILVTPERIQQESFLNQLAQLNTNAIGRFVIDEAHCATQWGHDFRPDYVQLGILRQHFPNVPILAVTATASPTVRDDVVRILRFNPINYQFYQSTANRPNLHYSVRAKSDNKVAVYNDMATYITSNFQPSDSGICYTFSRKEAEQVAAALCDHGIAAAPYHSSISAAQKHQVHSKWMTSRIQVVVATIAFGLGIHKPNVRFVLHHSISKTLEAYYQESGRAGRDGQPAHCVLWYSPKDVLKLLGMIAGTSAERCTFWPMCRYGQAHGNDAICRAILLKKLGEPNARDVTQVVMEQTEQETEMRNVTNHVRSVLQLLQAMLASGRNKKVTMSMLVKEWRSKNSSHDFLANNPPNKDLTSDECERIVVMMLIEETLHPRIVTNKNYGRSCVYLELANHVPQMIASPRLNVSIALPKNNSASPTKTTTPTTALQRLQRSNPQSTGWTTKTSSSAASLKKKASVSKKEIVPAKKKKASKVTLASTAKSMTLATKKRSVATVTHLKQKENHAPNTTAIVDLLGDDDDDDKVMSKDTATEEALWLSDDSEEEYEFED